MPLQDTVSFLILGQYSKFCNKMNHHHCKQRCISTEKAFSLMVVKHGSPELNAGAAPHHDPSCMRHTMIVSNHVFFMPCSKERMSPSFDEHSVWDLSSEVQDSDIRLISQGFIRRLCCWVMLQRDIDWVALDLLHLITALSLKTKGISLT